MGSPSPKRAERADQPGAKTLDLGDAVPNTPIRGMLHHFTTRPSG